MILEEIAEKHYGKPEWTCAIFIILSNGHDSLSRGNNKITRYLDSKTKCMPRLVPFPRLNYELLCRSHDF